MIRYILLILISFLWMPTVNAAPLGYYDSLIAYYHLLPKTEKNKAYIEKFHGCWAGFHHSKEWDGASSNEFKKARMIKQAEQEMNSKYQELKPFGKTFSFGYDSMIWKLGEYDFDSQSFPVEADGFHHKHDYRSFYMTLRMSDGSGRFGCMPSPQMLFLNDKDGTLKQLTLKMSPNKAENLVSKLSFRSIWPRVHFKFIDAQQSHSYLLVDLEKVELFSDNKFNNMIASINISAPLDSDKPIPEISGGSGNLQSTNNANQPKKIAASREISKKVQAGLNAAGFNAGAPDGIWGKGTAKAYSAWQTTVGEEPTGYLTEAGLKRFVQGQ